MTRIRDHLVVIIAVAKAGSGIWFKTAHASAQIATSAADSIWPDAQKSLRIEFGFTGTPIFLQRGRGRLHRIYNELKRCRVCPLGADLYFKP